MDLFQKIATFGDIPSPRFGHTLTKISPSKVNDY
jgi:hypothetical protein